MLPAALVSCSFFCLLAIYFSEKESRLKKQLLQKETEYKKVTEEMSFLKLIHDKIEACFDPKQMVDMFSKSLETIYPQATVAQLGVRHGKIFFKIISKEELSQEHMQTLRATMMASLKELYQGNLPEVIEEEKTGIMMEYTERKETIRSYAEFPITASGDVAGLVVLSSLQPGKFDHHQITELQKYLKQTLHTISRMQTTAEAEKAKVTSLIHTLEDGIVMIDKENSLSLINPLAKEILDIHQEHVTFEDIAHIFERKFDLKTLIAQVKESHGSIKQKDIAIGQKSLSISITPLKANTGSVDNGVILVIRDDTLEKSISKIKEDFTNAVVHELRSPLTAIKSSVSIILQENQNIDETTLKFLKLITSQTEQMLNDIASLLDAAKVESGRLTIVQRPNDIEKIIKSTIDLFEPQAKEKNVSIAYEVDPDIPQANCDELRIAQVLNNLISNSLKFTPADGHITITAKQTYNEHLPKTLTNPGILITVSDTGVGIPKEKQQNLFSKFAQAHPGSTEQGHGHKGSGLGLYITKGILIAHGGSIYLESEEGKGTKISFTLPIAGQKITAQITTARAILEQPLNVIGGLH